MRKFLTDVAYGFIIGHMIDKMICRVPSRLVLSKRILPGQPGYQEYYDRPGPRFLTIYFYSIISHNAWLINLRDETVRNDLSIRQWQDLNRVIEKKYLHELEGVTCSSDDIDTVEHSRVIGHVPDMLKTKLPSIIQFVQNVR